MFPSSNPFDEQKFDTNTSQWNQFTLPTDAYRTYEPTTFPTIEPAFLTLDQPIYRGIAVESSSLAIPSLHSQSHSSSTDYWANDFDTTINKLELTTPNTITYSTPIVPPSCPSYIERYFSFYSHSTPNTIMNELKRVFNEQQIDFEINESQAKIRALKCIPGASPLHFVVQIYTDSIPQQYIVEFQKRQGCCMFFNHLYKNLVCELKSIITSQVVPHNNDLPTIPCTELLFDAATIDCLSSMLGTDCESECFKALSNMNMSGATLEHLSIVEAGLRSSSDESQRGAAIMLSHITEQSSIKPSNMLYLLPLVFESLDRASSSLLSCEIKRWLVEALTHVPELSLNNDYITILSRYKHSPDTRLNYAVNQVLTRVC